MKPGARFTLIYKGKRDGWKQADFHRTCDGRGPLVILFKSSKNFSFGGYTSLPWSANGPGRYVEDRESFVFSLDQRELVFRPTNYKEALYHGTIWGPNFGGCDLAN